MTNQKHIDLAKEMQKPDGLHAQFYTEYGTRYQVHALSDNHVGIAAAIEGPTSSPVKEFNFVLDQQAALELMAGLRSVFREQEGSGW